MFKSVLTAAFIFGFVFLCLIVVPIITRSKEQKPVETPKVVEEVTPIPPPVFKCGNPRDLVIGTKVRDNCEDCKIPKGALGTITSGLIKCGNGVGFRISYDNYRAPDDKNGEFCTTPETLDIISQPRCEP